MLKLTVRFTGIRTATILLLFLVLSLLLSGSAHWVHRPSVQNGAAYLQHSSGRHFYLTNSSYLPDQALSACAAGYHMASFWEILDVTNLSYDYDHPDAYTKADSGYGPPSYWYGWVRTGQDSAGTNTAGMGNCLNWTDRTGTNYAVAVRLTRTWETPPNEITPWDATSFSCLSTAPVWCVGSFYPITLPLIVK